MSDKIYEWATFFRARQYVRQLIINRQRAVCVSTSRKIKHTEKKPCLNGPLWLCLWNIDEPKATVCSSNIVVWKVNKLFSPRSTYCRIPDTAYLFPFSHFASSLSSLSHVFIAMCFFFYPFFLLIYSSDLFCLTGFPLSFVSVHPSFSMTYSVFLSNVKFFILICAKVTKHFQKWWTESLTHEWCVMIGTQTRTSQSIWLNDWGLCRCWNMHHHSSESEDAGNRTIPSQPKDLHHRHPLHSSQLDELLQCSLETRFHSEVIQPHWLHCILHFTHPALMKFSHLAEKEI